LLTLTRQVIAISAGPKVTPHFAQQFESVIYFGPNLPQIQDSNGAAAGLAGKYSAREVHAEQVTKVARGPERRSTIADAPALWLHSTSDSAANLVALARSLVPPAASVSNQLPSALSQAPAAPVDPDEGAGPPLSTRGLVRRALSYLSMTEAAAVPPTAKGAETLAARSPQTFSAVAVPPAPADQARALNTKLLLPPPQAALPIDAPRPALPAAPAGISPAAPPRAAAESDQSAAAPSEFSVSEQQESGGRVDVVMSVKANSNITVPAWEPGTLTLSPSGDKSASPEGVIGSGIAHDAGKGAAMAGTSTGSGDRGEGFGSNEGALSGIAPGTHTGGTGGSSWNRTGVTISRSEVYLPSFGGTAEPSTPRRAPTDKSVPPSYVVMASSRGGGGLNPRFAPAGNRVYTIYLRTRSGSTVLQFADRGVNGAELTPPAPISIELPAGLKLARIVIGFVLDATGRLRDFHVAEAPNAALAAQVITALSHWQFRPALRGDQPLAVNAVIGFGVNTN
jgi:hypothetical protein